MNRENYHNREQWMTRVMAERERQFNLPGREFDGHNNPNDWTAIVGHYLCETVRRGANKPTRADYEDSLVKAAAVILAALEHCPMMATRDSFNDELSLDMSSGTD